jgi:hypothetical protein
MVIGMLHRTPPEGRAETSAKREGDISAPHGEAESNQRAEKIEQQKQRLARIKANAISAAELASIYQRNEVYADNLFRGREIVVRGTVGKIAKEILGRPYVILDEPRSGFGSVQCVFRSAETRLASLLPGNVVYVSGTVQGKTMNVILTGCTLLTGEDSW